MLGFWFGGYVIGHTHLGYGIPLFLLAGYVVGSFWMECRGEPAGRGRLRRGLIVLAAALVAMPAFLAATAPVVMRWDAKLGLGNTTVYPAPSGKVAFVLNDWQRALDPSDVGGQFASAASRPFRGNGLQRSRR